MRCAETDFGKRREQKHIWVAQRIRGKKSGWGEVEWRDSSWWIREDRVHRVQALLDVY